MPHTGARNTYFKYLKDTATIKYNLDGSIIVASVTDNTYDLNYGNVTFSTQTSGAGFSGTFDASTYFDASNITGVQQTVTTDSTFLNSEAVWRIGFLSNRSVTYSVPDDVSKTLVSEYTPYNTETFLTKSETQYKNTDVSITKTFTRDTYGNVTDTTITGGGLVSRSTSTSNFVNGIFPADLTNDLGTATYTFDQALGKLLKSVDINEQTTDTLYDDFGRLVLTKTADGTEIQTTYSACGAGCPTHGVCL